MLLPVVSDTRWLSAVTGVMERSFSTFCYRFRECNTAINPSLVIETSV